MCTRFRVAALATLCLLPASVRPAYGDPITVMISATGNGSFGSQVFQDRTVTFTAQTTTEEIAACESGSAISGCSYFSNQFSRSIAVPYTSGTITVQGFGTYATVGQDELSFFAGTIDLNQIRLGSATGGLNLGVTAQPLGFGYDFAQTVPTWNGGPEGSFLDQSCDQGPASECPLFAPTTGGNLVLTTAFSGATGEVLVGSTSPVPEPESWVMVGTGLVGGLGAMRRRLGR